MTGIPPRLARSLESLARWGRAGVHLVPVRHHSPGCAQSLTALLEEVRPTRVLIEGPREYTALLPALGDPRTRPPIAVLSTDESRAAFYPLAQYSPEWVALRWGLAQGALVDFIDQSYALQGTDEQAPDVRTLQAEHHLARSASIAALAARLGCRDHDEVWEHLFEVRATASSDWRTYFSEVFAWGALARLDSERSILDADGTHAREAVMSAMIARHREAAAGPLVIVTGAFHTLGLLDVLDATPEGAWVTRHPAGDLDVARPAWLIRYDNTRLDGLRGYGAGMPAPGFWARAWAARSATDPGHDASSGLYGEGPGPVANPARGFVVGILVDIARQVRDAGEPLGAATVLAASEQALRLAELRGRAWPGRTDVLDALLSCFVKDDIGFSGSLRDAITTVFGGTELGEVPPGLASPPLVAEARREASRLRFTVDDAAPRRVSLDTARKPGHVRRREFLATMRFVGADFCRQVGGADLIAGTGLGTLHEDWEYAWTPMVEAALISATHDGPTLAAVVRARVRERTARAGHSSTDVAALLAELLVMGAVDEVTPVLDQLRACYDSDPAIASLVASLHRVVALVTAGGRLSPGPHTTSLTALVEAGLAALAYQVSSLAGVDQSDLPGVCDTLLSLRALLTRLDQNDAVRSSAALAVRRELRRLRATHRTPARLRGCLLGLAYCDQELAEPELQSEVAAHLSPGADPDRVSGFLLGLMQAAPDLILHTPELLGAVDASLSSLPEESFLAILPDLRKAFTWLRPTETHRLAGLVAGLTGTAATDLDAVIAVDRATAESAMRAERDLVASLTRDGLEAWAGA